jgi:type II secretory pathway pseudopilin PulG
MMKNNFTAFTLAEVLITLLIIGVVSSLVIPALINDTQKQEYVVALQKSYAELSQATKLLIVENGGDLSYSVFGHGVSSHDLNEFANKLSVTKRCYGTTGCWHSDPIKWLNGTYSGYDPDGGYNNAILNNGITISVAEYGASCTTSRGTGPLESSVCGYMIVDVNGTKGPNTFGRDEYMFWITKTGLYPFGIDYATSFTNCTTAYGDGCAAKVLKEGKMNY